MTKRLFWDLCFFSLFLIVLILLMIICSKYGIYAFSGTFLVSGVLLTLFASKLSEKKGG